jgi:hypothetical protein
VKFFALLFFAIFDYLAAALPTDAENLTTTLVIARDNAANTTLVDWNEGVSGAVENVFNLYAGANCDGSGVIVARSGNNGCSNIHGGPYYRRKHNCG